MNTYWLIAGMMSGATFFIHVFLGGRGIARPLLANETLKDIPKYTSYLCWHMVSILLFAMSVAYCYAAWIPSAFELAFLMTALSASFIVLNIGIIIFHKLKFFAFPQWILFFPIAAFGGLGFIL